MTMPPTHYFHNLGPQAQMMAKNCGNERLAMVMNYVALGSMIIMAGYAAKQLLKDVFDTPDSHRGHDRSR